MGNALLSDVEARAERRRTRTRADAMTELGHDAWRRSQEASTPAEALRWLDRAHRLVPKDTVVAMALATALLRAGEAERAAGLFQELSKAADDVEALIGTGTCALLLGRAEQARGAVSAALRRRVPDLLLRQLADAVAALDAPGGWCGLTGEGRLLIGGAKPLRVRLDGAALPVRWRKGEAPLPRGWETAGRLEVEGADGPFLGSPLNPASIPAVEGFVEAWKGGLRGWAWHPADPGRPPLVLVRARSFGAMLQLRERDDPAEDRPLAAHGFELSAQQVAAMGGPLHVVDHQGRALLGSPVDPALLDREPVRWADAIGPAPVPGTPAPASVVIPVHRGLRETLACLDSVLDTVPPGTPVHVVDDASPEPELVAALQGLAGQGRIVLHRQACNAGFPAAANLGLRACAGRDVVLLNSDTTVPPGWLPRLRAAAYSAPDIGTATPLSNDATILSYPDRDGGNPMPGPPDAAALDGLAQQANGAEVVDIPVGVGFCLYIRRDCLDATGPLREDVFAQGYGEENDFCLRARHLGWRSVAAAGVFVAHVGGRSFGQARRRLRARNALVLERLHPGHDALVAAHLAADPLALARRRMDALRFRREVPAGGAVLITHAGGGGVDVVVQARVAALQEGGPPPLLLRPAPGGCVVDGYPNLAYRIPGELHELAALLRAARPSHVELHHMLGHGEAVAGLAGLLGVPLDSYVHDYAAFCPRIALVGRDRRYCGEPDLPACEACIADLGSLLEDDPPVAALRRRSAAVLAGSRRVVVPSGDAAARLRRHFPGVWPEVRPWEDDALLPPLRAAAPAAVRRVCVVGAIGVEKGYDVLLGCARDARARGLGLEFVVVGYTADDARLLEAGPVFITGEYREEEAVRLIAAQAAHLALIPSVWPETWCFALSRAWQAGLAVAAFNLGAQAERIGRTRRGWLLPLGLSPRGVNDALLALAPPDRPLQCPPPVR